MNLADKLKNKATATLEGLKNQYGLNTGGNEWPQTKYQAVLGLIEGQKAHTSKGFLPPTMIEPTLGSERKYGQYTYKDWRGQILNIIGNQLNSSDRFSRGNIPKLSSDESPYSTIDNYIIFNDNSTNYFRHGLHILNNLTPFAENRTDGFKYTPFEKNDPVMFGFDVVLDDISSPLLNGSILDFLNNYSNISEISSKIPVYEEFKNQFIKFFKTKATVRIEEENGLPFTSTDNISKLEHRSDDVFLTGKDAYMAYYLIKVGGLDKLIEQNTPSTKKFLAEYNKDVISLTFREDLTLSIGTLGYLYKLLYWSKPNGKTLIPENLLRFNCDIIISEVRNYNRVVKAVETGNVEVIKDNVSRYIYSLKECQLYFNTMAHDAEVDLSNIKVFDNYTIQFDFKYSTVKLERFVPKSNGIGQYIGYDSGSIWKIGNVTDRTTTEAQTITNTIRSVPLFNTTDSNINQNGSKSPFVMYRPSDNIYDRKVLDTEVAEESGLLDKFKKGSTDKAKQLKNNIEDTLISSALKEAQTYVNSRVALLNKSLNKVLNASGITGIRPPTNVYEKDIKPGQNIFYDVRGQLINFVGGSVGGALGGGFTGGQFTQR